MGAGNFIFSWHVNNVYFILKQKIELTAICQKFVVNTMIFQNYDKSQELDRNLGKTPFDHKNQRQS